MTQTIHVVGRTVAAATAKAFAKHQNVTIGAVSILHWLRTSEHQPDANQSKDLSSHSLTKTVRHYFEKVPCKNKTATAPHFDGRAHRQTTTSESRGALQSCTTAAHPTGEPIPMDSSTQEYCDGGNRNATGTQDHIDRTATTLDVPVYSAMRRLLIEDILTLPVDPAKPMLLYFTSQYSDYKQLSKYYELSPNPAPLLVVQGVSFFLVRVTVEKNCCANDLARGLLTRPEFNRLFLGKDNESIFFRLCDAAPTTSSHNSLHELRLVDFVAQKSSLMLFAHLPWRRKFGEAFNKVGKQKQKLLFRHLADEVRYDAGLTWNLIAAYANYESTDSKVPVDLMTQSFDTFLGAGIVGSQLEALDEVVDVAVMKEIRKCYGDFVSWTDAIIPDAVLDLLVDHAFRLVPHLMNAVMVRC